MCRPHCTWPNYYALPEVPGVPGVRAVHGVWMTEEEYRVTGWHSRGSYTTAKGTTEHLWIAPLGGHMEWARLTWQRREQGFAAARERRQSEDEYSASVAQMIEEARP